MTWNDAQRLAKAAVPFGIDAEVQQFTPDRDGWAVLVGGYVCRTHGELATALGALSNPCDELSDILEREA